MSMTSGLKPGSARVKHNKHISRLAELRADYPAETEFFDKNAEALLESMEDVRSENELNHLHQSFEAVELTSNVSYDYPSTSVFAVEDLLIDLLDFKRELFRQVGKYDKLDILH
jgi:hypothetical protein